MHVDFSTENSGHISVIRTLQRILCAVSPICLPLILSLSLSASQHPDLSLQFRTMASQIPMNAARPPHFVLIPLFTQGHMIPMVDIARLIADRGAHVTFITTPVNAARIKPIINRVKAAGLPIRFVELEFPCREGGLPDGCENCDLVPSFDLMKPFFEAMRLLREPLLLYLQELNPGPTCMITDCIQYWTADIARSLNIPRLIFHGPSAFYILCKENIERSKVYESVDDEYVPVVVPNLPQKIEINQAQAPVWFHPPGTFSVWNLSLVK